MKLRSQKVKDLIEKRSKRVKKVEKLEAPEASERKSFKLARKVCVRLNRISTVDLQLHVNVNSNERNVCRNSMNESTESVNDEQIEGNEPNDENAHGHLNDNNNTPPGDRVEFQELEQHVVSTIDINVNERGNDKRNRMEFITRPTPLKLDGNIAENWKRFKRSFDTFMVATEYNTKTDDKRIALFLNVLGEDGNDAYDTFNLSVDERAVYATVIKSFNDFCKPKTNEVYERFVFYQRSQKNGEPFDTFLLDIRQLVKTCEFGEMEDAMLRDRIVMGVTNKKLQRHLLETANLTYTQAVEKSRADEKTQEQTTNMNKAVNKTTSIVNEVRDKTSQSRNEKGPNNKGNSNTNTNAGNSNTNNRQSNSGNQSNGQTRHFYRNKGNSNQKNSNQNSNSNNNVDRNKNNNPKSSFICKRCNYNHAKNQCPAYGKNCHLCSKPNHFGSVCFFNKTVNAINARDFDEYTDNSDLYCSSLSRIFKRNVRSINIGARPRWKEDIEINGKLVSFKVDTGSDATILPKRLLDMVAPRCELYPSRTVFRGFGGSVVKPIGVCKLPCTLNSQTKTIEIEIVETDDVPLLGFIAAVQFNLINIQQINDYRTRSALKHFL